MTGGGVVPGAPAEGVEWAGRGLGMTQRNPDAPLGQALSGGSCGCGRRTPESALRNLVGAIAK